MKLVIATKNRNKINEIADKLKGLNGIEFLSLLNYNAPPDVIEDGKTFVENALKKAREISHFTSLPAMADDSGLVIDALNGEPGVLSARYAGGNATDADRNNLVLEKLKNIPRKERSARFICIIAIALPDGEEFFAEGVCEGIIGNEMRGENGFGYDPIFFLPEFNRTMAELTLSEKNKISHRARALDRVKEILVGLTHPPSPSL
jgi:XTP/dITP diphosphohydrolase